MKSGWIIKIFIAALTVAAVGYWLFIDTVRFYSSSDDAKPLRVSFYGASEEFEAWTRILKSFREDHPEIPVKSEYFPVFYAEKIQQQMVADNAADVILYQDEPFYGMVEANKFEDLMPYYARDGVGGPDALRQRFWAQAVDSFGRWEEFQGERAWRQYAAPVFGGCNLIFYNLDLFEQARIRVTGHDGPGAIKEAPDGEWLLDDERWTIDDFVRVCQKLTLDKDGDGRTDQFGTVIPRPMYWFPFHWSMGGDILTEDKQNTALYGPASEASFQLFHDLRWTYRVAPTPADMGNLTDNTGFFTGLVAMYCNGPWSMPFCNAVAKEGLRYDVLHIPRNNDDGYRATRITWDGLAMYAGSKKKDDAWVLIQYLTARKAQRVMAELQRAIPAELVPEEVFERAIGQKSPRPGDDAYAGVYFTTVNPDVSADKFVQAINEYGRLQPITAHWSDMIRSWQQSLNGLQRIKEADRYTPEQAIGRFHADKGESRKLNQNIPPSEPDQAERYRLIYEGSGKP